MRAFRRVAKHAVTLVELPRPEPGAGELFVRPLLSGLCGTDLHVLAGEGFDGIPVPLTMGHEVCGEVVAVGPGSEQPTPYPRLGRPPRPGDRVVVEPVLPCGRCPYCRRGHPNLCARMSHLGIWRDGNFADYVVVPAARALVVPDDVSTLDGLLVEITACGLNAVDQAAVRPGETVFVIGGGAMGQVAAQCALAAGAALVILSEPQAHRRALAGRAGVHLTLDPHAENVVDAVRAQTGELGADAAIECVGAGSTIQQALDATRRQGRCVLAGIPSEPVTLDVAPVVFGEKRVRGALASAWQFERALALIAAGRVHPRLMVDAPRPFLDLPSALEDLRTRPDLCKIVLDHGTTEPRRLAT
jgi:L-iditol 2-dehydrogenase